MIEHLKQTKAGFTLVELIVVIAILAILSGIAIPVYSGYISKANEAADLQLLSAVNTAWAAACADRGLDPTRVVGLATLSGDPGNKTISNITANGSGAVALSGGGESFNDAFLRYYGDNINTPFKVYNSLGYDMANGVFVDGATEVTVMYNGNPVTVTMAQITAYQASTFGALGVESVLNQVDGVVDAASAVLAGLASNGELNTSLKKFLNQSYGITEEQFNALSPTEKSNALVLMVASKAKNLDVEALVSEFNQNGYIDLSSIMTEGDTGSFAIDTATGLTIPYALAMAYVNSDYVQKTPTSWEQTYTYYKNGVEITEDEYYAAEDEACTAAMANGSWDNDAYMAIMSQYTADWDSPTILWSDYVDTKTLFYEGGYYNNCELPDAQTLQNGQNIAGANHMSDANDINDLLAVITSSPGFSAYMASGQAAVDLEGFVTAMNMLDSNAGNIDTNDLLTNGFGDESLQAMVAAILGG